MNSSLPKIESTRHVFMQMKSQLNELTLAKGREYSTRVCAN